MGWHMCGNYGYADGWMFFGGMFFMILFPIAFLLLLVWIVYAVVSKEGGGKHEEGREIQIAKERYAKGEITKEEYEEVVKTLKK